MSLLKRKKVIEKATSINQENEIVKTPKVIYKGYDLQVFIGKWISQSSYENIEDLEKTLANFGTVLSLIGINPNETCIIDELNEQEQSFHCHLKEANEDMKMSLDNGDGQDFGPELEIIEENGKRVYEYYPERSTRALRVALRQQIIQNEENVYKKDSHYYTVDITAGNATNDIAIKINPVVEADDFTLPNERKLQKYLLGLTFPVEMSEIYPKIVELFQNEIEEYPTFSLQIKKKMNIQKDEIVDAIFLNYGNLDKYIATRDGKQITYSGNGSWNYNTPTIEINRNQEDKISYKLEDASFEELAEMTSPAIQYQEVVKEVENVKVLAKSYLKKD